MRPNPRAVVAIATLGVAVLAAHARAQEPAKSSSLARYFPGKDLVVYAEFDGLDAHDAAWKKTATYKLLTETSTGAMLDALVTQGADAILSSSPPSEKKPTGAEVIGVAKHLVRSGFAFGINRRAGEPKPFSIGLVIRGGAKGAARGPLSRLIDAANGPGVKAEPVTKPGDRRVIVVADRGGSGFAWWTEKDDLAMSLMTPKNVDVMIDALDGRVPNATTNRARADLAKVSDGFEPVGLAFFDMAALPVLPPQAASLGLDRVRRLDYRWGFQDDALMTVTRIVAPSPRTGVLALLDLPTFSVKTLPPIAAGVNSFTVFSLDPDHLYDQVSSLARAADPNAQAQFAQVEQIFRQVTGQKLREDVLKHLGPKFATYTVPTRGNLPTNALMGFASGMVHVPKTVVLIEVRESESFAKVLDALVGKANEALRAQLGGGEPAKVEGLGFLPLKGVPQGYVLALPPSVFPIPAGMRPTMILGKKYLVVGTTPDVAKKALAIEGKAGSMGEGELAKVLGRLPKDLILLSVDDTRESLLPEIVSNLPGLVSLFSASANGPGGRASFTRMLGIPVPGGAGRGGPGVMLKIDPELVPSPDDLRPFLFPATYAVTVNEDGISFVSRESFPGLNPTTALPLVAAMTFPAIGSARSAAQRSQSVNNMKQVGLGIHNFVSANNKLPDTIRDKDGKPLLSWRVAILPFLEQQALFNEFKMDEPWDSPHNKPLMARMPATFSIPNSPAEPGMTFYRSFSGPSTLFDPTAKKGLSFADITDGLSNTLALVEAREAVEWSKPDNEIPFDEKAEDAKGILEKLGGHFPGGFNALLLDGSVRFVKESINPVILKALITRNAGEVVGGDAFN